MFPPAATPERSGTGGQVPDGGAFGPVDQDGGGPLPGPGPPPGGPKAPKSSPSSNPLAAADAVGSYWLFS